MTERPLNACHDCDDTWHPRGRDLSKKCPCCGSRDVYIVQYAPDDSWKYWLGGVALCVALYFWRYVLMLALAAGGSTLVFYVARHQIQRRQRIDSMYEAVAVDKDIGTYRMVKGPGHKTYDLPWL